MTPFNLIQVSGSPIEKIVQQFEVNQDKGITSFEALERLRRYGANAIIIQGKKRWWRELLSHFNSPLIILLVAASIISFAVSETLDATIIVVMLLMSVLIDYFREREANNAAEKLQLKVKTKALVIRDGSEKEILFQELVPGDIVLLRPDRKSVV